MSWYRRTKFTLDAFRSFTSKIVPKENPVQNLTAKPTEKIRASELGIFAGISRNSGTRIGLRRDHSNPFSCGARRYYYVDRDQIRHFKPRGYKKWFQNPKYVYAVVLVSSGVVISVYLGHLEAIPYSNRTHFVLLSTTLEKKMGESQFQEMKKGFRGKILPPIHPESVRVRLIAKDLIEALQRGLKKEHIWKDSAYGTDEPSGGSKGDGHETLIALSESSPTVGGNWSKEDEILDDKWVEKSRKEGKQKGKEPSTHHLEGLNWEVLVVNEPVVNAFCLPGGKIVVFTGLLDHFRTDSEIATILGHEVAHAVARHSAEGITKNLWFAIMQLILYQFVMPDLVNTMSNLFLKLPFSRRMEMEADYIGLLLMASAGYDPRVAPKVYQRLGQITGESSLRDYLSTHPSGKKRSKLLAEAKVMQEALLIYQETQSGRGRGIEGFL